MCSKILYWSHQSIYHNQDISFTTPWHVNPLCVCNIAAIWLLSMWNPLDSYTVPLHNPNCRHLPAVRAVKGDCQWLLKFVKIPISNHEPSIHCSLHRIQCRWGFSQSIFKPIYCKKVSYPINSPTDTRLRVCSSLCQCGIPCKSSTSHWQHYFSVSPNIHMAIWLK